MNHFEAKGQDVYVNSYCTMSHLLWFSLSSPCHPDSSSRHPVSATYLTLFLLRSCDRRILTCCQSQTKILGNCVALIGPLKPSCPNSWNWLHSNDVEPLKRSILSFYPGWADYQKCEQTSLDEAGTAIKKMNVAYQSLTFDVFHSTHSFTGDHHFIIQFLEHLGWVQFRFHGELNILIIFATRSETNRKRKCSMNSEKWIKKYHLLIWRLIFRVGVSMMPITKSFAFESLESSQTRESLKDLGILELFLVVHNWHDIFAIPISIRFTKSKRGMYYIFFVKSNRGSIWIKMVVYVFIDATI